MVGVETVCLRDVGVLPLRSLFPLICRCQIAWRFGAADQVTQQRGDAPVVSCSAACGGTASGRSGAQLVQRCLRIFPNFLRWHVKYAVADLALANTLQLAGNGAPRFGGVWGQRVVRVWGRQSAIEQIRKVLRVFAAPAVVAYGEMDFKMSKCM